MSDLPLFDPYKALAEIRRARKDEATAELSQKLSQTPAKENAEQKQSVDPTFATFADPQHVRSLPHPPAREEERKKIQLFHMLTRGRARMQAPKARPAKRPLRKLRKPRKLT